MTSPSNYDFYWRTYERCSNWIRNHGYSMITPLGRARRLLASSEFSQQRSPGIQISETDTSNTDTETLLSVDSVDVAYLEALKINRAHQAERDRRRAEEKKTSAWIDYVDLTQVQSYSTKAKAPTGKNLKGKHKKDKIDWNREISTRQLEKVAQYKETYGTDLGDISAILIMETELQADFDRFCDHYQPGFWPHLPVRIVFDK